MTITFTKKEIEEILQEWVTVNILSDDAEALSATVFYDHETDIEATVTFKPKDGV